MLFIFDKYPDLWSSAVRNSSKWCHGPWPVGGWSHPVKGPTNSIGFKLAVHPACHLVNLHHVHLAGCMVHRLDDVVVGRVFPPHVQVQELLGIVWNEARVQNDL